MTDADHSAARPAAPADVTDPLPPVDELEAFVAQGTDEDLHDFLLLLHPADIAELLWEVDERYWPRILDQVPDARLADTLVELEGGTQDDLLALLTDARLSRLVAFLDSDDAADLVSRLPREVRERIVGALARRDRSEVEKLLQYDEETAGGIMQTELCSVHHTATVGEAISAVRGKSRELGESLHFVYVLDDEERLVGQVRMVHLLLAPDETPVADVQEPSRYVVHPELDQEDVAEVFRKYDLVTLAVVDDEGHLLGRILIDDILDVMQEEADEDLMRMVGASEEDLVYSDRILKVSAYRLPALLIALAGTLVTTEVIRQFEHTLSQVLTMAMFIPVVIAMGGNVGSQSSTILTRGFATGRVDTENLLKVLIKEFLVGLITGIACGALAALVAALWHGEPMLGIVVAISMVIAMTTAATIGTLAPATFKKFNIDPAIAAGPFVTTTNDITGVVIYFGTATLFLEWLVP